MSFELADNGMRLRFQLTPTAFAGAEISVFTMYTGKRDAGQLDAVLDEMHKYVEALVVTEKAVASYSEFAAFIDEWQNPILSADHWGALRSSDFLPLGAGEDAPLPAQVACVVTRDTLDQDLPKRRRRNRSYFGPIVATKAGPTGAPTVALKTGLLTQMSNFSQALANIPLKGGVPTELAGLCNVSYAGSPGLLTPARIARTDIIRVGSVFDTQRSRRKQLAEIYTSQPI